MAALNALAWRNEDPTSRTPGVSPQAWQKVYQHL
jgi:hypothetical protein